MRKRILIASVLFDLESSNTSFNVPVGNIFWSLENNKKPFHVFIRIQWKEFNEYYPYRTFKKTLQKMTHEDIIRSIIKENFSHYKGKLVCDNSFFPETGKCIHAARNKKQIDRWIKLKQL